MSRYFDQWDSEVREAADEDQCDEFFLDRMKEIERVRVRTISLVTGDREFPNIWREDIQRLIALFGVSLQDPSEKAIRLALMVRSSRLSGELHEVFHRLASARFVTRFGWLNDNPEDILGRRDEHDEEATR